MPKRINKPIPCPYDSAFKNQEEKNDFKKEAKSIQTAEQGCCRSSSVPIALALILLFENNRETK